MAMPQVVLGRRRRHWRLHSRTADRTFGLMSPTRDNHYVPRWYQKGFFEPGRQTLAYLDLYPATKVLADGQTISGRAKFDAPPKRCFFQTDLYSTFFLTSVNDEIERFLFGAIDTRGSLAVRAFLGTDAAAWHDNFQTFFEYTEPFPVPER